MTPWVATGRTSELGETLDGFCDSLSFGLVYAAAALSFVVHGHGSAPLIVLLGLVAAFSHSLQSSLVDLERGDCRYPYGGDEEGEAITFCGHPRRPGSSYCAPHFHLSCRPGTPSERAAHIVLLRMIETA